jgi:hypothetical protein
MDITTKFGQFKDRKLKSFDKEHEYDGLSDDITIISKLDTGDYKKVTEPVEIVQVTGIITDEDEIKKLDEASGIPPINVDLSLKEVKRGQEIWMTALLKKPGSSVFNNQSLGLIKVRIVDIYFGLSKLSSIMK